MQSITVNSDSPIFHQVVKLLAGLAPDQTPGTSHQPPAETATVVAPPPTVEAAHRVPVGSHYASWNREEIVNEIKDRGILKRVHNSRATNDLIAMLIASDTKNGGKQQEEEETEEEETEEEETEEEETDVEEETEEEEETEVEEEGADIEIGMAVKLTLKGKATVGTVTDIDYEAGKVKVKAKDGKIYKVDPANLEAV